MDETVLDVVPDRESDAVKGDSGHVLVVGGSRRYTNTPAIVALGALRSGTDLVTVAAPDHSARIAPTFALNTVTEPLDGPALAPGHVDTVIELAERADCVAIGPGLGRADGTAEAVRSLLAELDAPAVVDADAIHAVADDPDVLDPDTVVTPHAGEFAALTGEELSDDVDRRRETVAAAARALGCTVLAKGPVDVISGGDRTVTNATGNPYMTRGGTGDTLTGITAALRAVDVAPVDAAHVAAHLNGAAGDAALAAQGAGFLLEELLAHLSEMM